MSRLLWFVPVLAAFTLLADSTKYSYDDAGRLTQVVYPNGQTITYTYDKAGNLLSREVTSAGQSAAKKQPSQKKERDQRKRAR